MLFEDYRNQLPAVKPGAYRLDKAARRSGGQRDPFATEVKRVAASRLVAQAEQKLGDLDLPEDVWERVISTLGDFSEADWRALAGVDDLLPLKKSKKAPRRQAGDGE
jgi:hypothetical protein